MEKKFDLHFCYLPQKIGGIVLHCRSDVSLILLNKFVKENTIVLWREKIFDKGEGNS